MKNQKNGLYYSYEDTEVKVINVKDIRQCQPYILFYQLKRKQEISLVRNLKSQVQLLKNQEMKLEVDQLAYLPGFWYQSLLHTARPGPIMTSHLLCKHGQIKPDYFDCFPPKFLQQNKRNTMVDIQENSVIEGSMCIDFDSNLEVCETEFAVQYLKQSSQIVPIQIVGYLVETFGGGPIIPCDLEICIDCILFSRQIRRRRKLEKELIFRYEKKYTLNNYIVEEDWVQEWSEYLFQTKKFLKTNFIKGFPTPKQINNRRLIGANSQMKPNLKKNEHFRVFNEYIWMIFKQLYGSNLVLMISDTSSRHNIPNPSFSREE